MHALYACDCYALIIMLARRGASALRRHERKMAEDDARRKATARARADAQQAQLRSQMEAKVVARAAERADAIALAATWRKAAEEGARAERSAAAARAARERELARQLAVQISEKEARRDAPDQTAWEVQLNARLLDKAQAKLGLSPIAAGGLSAAAVAGRAIVSAGAVGSGGGRAHDKISIAPTGNRGRQK